MPKVALAACPGYEAEVLRPALKKAVSLAADLGSLIRPGDRVLLKPNLLLGTDPSRRVTTDPALVREVGRLVKDLGAEIWIGDSPALEGTRRAAKRSGLAETARGLGAEIKDFNEPVRVSAPAGSVFKSLELARPVLEADVVINLPKLKTHCQMLLTLGVKNLFGSVVAQRKAEWHHMVGADRDTFASLLLDIERTVAPALTILDGVWGMHVMGPQNGEPFHYGFLAAGTNTLALDLAVCDLLGVDRSRFPLARAAKKRRLLPRGIELAGDPADIFRPKGMVLPSLDSLDIIPGFLDGFTRRFLVSRPVADPDLCISCGECARICPERAVGFAKGPAVFDHDRCIRCYCCHEVCPEDAISFRKGLLVRLLQRIGR